MGSQLRQRLDDLRRQIQELPKDVNPSVIGGLERTARTLLTDAKNTPYEPAAQALFAELAQLSNPTSPTAATVRGLVRRARIRIEIAGDDDVDEAIDILTEALALNPSDADVLTLLNEAANRSQQAQQRVNNLFAQYGIQQRPEPPPTKPQPTLPTSTSPAPPPQYPTSSGYSASKQLVDQAMSKSQSDRYQTANELGEALGIPSKPLALFLSYSRRDTQVMQRLRDDLRAAQLNVWVDEEGLEPGTPAWEAAIGNAIRSAACLLVILSPDAEKSIWVGRELAMAETLNKRIFPVLVRGTEQDAIPFRLMTHQWIDARQDYAGAFDRLLGAVKKHLGM